MHPVSFCSSVARFIYARLYERVSCTSCGAQCKEKSAEMEVPDLGPGSQFPCPLNHSLNLLEGDILKACNLLRVCTTHLISDGGNTLRNV